jgi:hypothetical protein
VLKSLSPGGGIMHRWLDCKGANLNGLTTDWILNGMEDGLFGGSKSLWLYLQLQHTEYVISDQFILVYWLLAKPHFSVYS